MNEADTRAQLIDPQLAQAGWGVLPESQVQREVHITKGRIAAGRGREKPLIADYVLLYKGRKLAVVEAKSEDVPVTQGLAQAKAYAAKLQVPFAFAANGRQLYQADMRNNTEGLLPAFPSPESLWSALFSQANAWREKFDAVPFERIGGSKETRYYQEIAVQRVMDAIAESKTRILLTLATGTGKTFIAFQIVWKLFYTRWNLQHTGQRRPRVLFLADRNILANQAFNAFSAFPADALSRIKPDQIQKDGRVPTNANIFFTIFQTFMSGPNGQPYFGDYPPDFFDLIIIDECHRGGANDESNWRAIMEHFSPAVQLGLTATPKRQDNADTYRYFGDPVYVYSLKEGINDGFLTPFRVKRIKTTLDDYMYTSDDVVVEGEIEQGRLYIEPDFNRIIEIKARERKRVEIFLEQINQKEKTIVFCATQEHALAVRDLVNQISDSRDPFYCVRVTANDGSLGEQYLRDFQDNEKTIPTILTTSQKLSTGVDARNIRNIVLMRPINSMIEFKQIIGRGTRLFEGKEYFTVYDFVEAYHHFSDPEWDGEPEAPEPPAEPKSPRGTRELGPTPLEPREPGPKQQVVRVMLPDGKAREIQHMISTSFWSTDGKPISSEEFMQQLFGKLPAYFTDEAELRRIWSNPDTRKALLERLADAGFGHSELSLFQKLIQAENSDLFDVLEYVAYAVKPIARENRVAAAQSEIFDSLSPKEKEFLEFVLQQYIQSGVDELAVEKLPQLLNLKYFTLPDAVTHLGEIPKIRALFIGFQKHLYQQPLAV